LPHVSNKPKRGPTTKGCIGEDPSKKIKEKRGPSPLKKKMWVSSKRAE